MIHEVLKKTKQNKTTEMLKKFIRMFTLNRIIHSNLHYLKLRSNIKVQ